MDVIKVTIIPGLEGIPDGAVQGAAHVDISALSLPPPSADPVTEAFVLWNLKKAWHLHCSWQYRGLYTKGEFLT